MALLGVVLAAGASRRFGADDKLLAVLRGRPLVQHSATTMLAAHPDRLMAVVSSVSVANLLPRSFERSFVAPGGDLSDSFRIAIDAARPEDDRVLICLGDMPNVPASVFENLLALPGSGACVFNGRRMPPLLLWREDFSAARAAAEGDSGGRSFIAGLPASRLIILDEHDAHDIDRPSDIAARHPG